MAKSKLKPRTVFEEFFGREDEGEDKDMYGGVIDDIKEQIVYYEEYTKDWNPSNPPLERPPIYWIV